MPTLDERVAILKQAGFRVVKYRSLKSGEQYKIALPKTLNKLHAVYYTRVGLENAVNFAEGLMEAWEVVQPRVFSDLEALSEKYGLAKKK